MDRCSALELESRTKDTRISAMQSSNEVHIKEFEKRYSKWDKEKNRLGLQITKMEAEMTAQAERIRREQKDAHAREIREVWKELEAEKKSAATLDEKLERASTKIKTMEMELALCNGRLREWEDHVSGLKDIDLEAL
jgi:chromosome segregation ATPase